MPGSDITHFPQELGHFISALPAPGAVLGPASDVDGVIEVRRLLVLARCFRKLLVPCSYTFSGGEDAYEVSY